MIHSVDTTLEVECCILSFGQSVRFYRKNKGWTQQQLAERLASTKQWISAIENGKPSVKLETVKKLALIFDVSMAKLLND